MSARCKIIQTDREIDKVLYNNVTKYNNGFIEIGEERIVMPIKYLDLADGVENFHVRETDIFVASHPRTGTTWTTEMVWNICNMDYETEVPMIVRFPFLEGSAFFDFQDFKKLIPDSTCENTVEFTESIVKNPRFIKTHLPWSVLPKEIRDGQKKPKIIYVYRNPKDTVVSYYHFLRARNYSSDFDEFCKLFLAGRLPCGPFWTNVLEYWNRRNDPNILFIRYEDMKKDLKSVIVEVCGFLDKTLSGDEIEKLANYLDFDSMSKIKLTGISDKSLEKKGQPDEVNSRMIRKGIVGGYKKEMSEEKIERFDEWVKENINGTDFEI